ncbi:hypothetical protein AVEN_217606-1 [Araneus ventricosus]|uniref:Uncharacterized protein n=1 Tax=Araneus ventricosus TaxID=182803 RepID=A0A4Y2FEL2_ARAVE|nr:hypothetical protein AVEN_217606-1 [Araneus ventricosus]
MDWQSYSPDRNPCDFFLWDHLKDEMYRQNSITLVELEQIIRPEMCSYSISDGAGSEVLVAHASIEIQEKSIILRARKRRVSASSSATWAAPRPHPGTVPNPDCPRATLRQSAHKSMVSCSSFFRSLSSPCDQCRLCALTSTFLEENPSKMEPSGLECIFILLPQLMEFSFSKYDSRFIKKLLLNIL